MVALGALAGVGADQLAPPRAEPAHWREIAWPFPRDGWPAGRAFRCEGGVCADGVELIVRAKRGFCNCDRGVADDDEVDRVADIDLISPRFAAAGTGEPIRLGGMQGRARSYDLEMPDGIRHAATGIAVSRRCDVLVAVTQGSTTAGAMRHEALAFLERVDMKAWMIAALDGR
ncbi:MAG: hypothetical protein KGM94_02385 [Bradyrhizobium sp.]|nr:hypothetical protein [Bradyrhizobium sp.]